VRLAYKCRWQCRPGGTSEGSQPVHSLGCVKRAIGPQFGEPTPTPDPTKFSVKHGSDSQAYKILDSQKGSLQPRPFPIASEAEPRLTLGETLGKKGSDIENAITRAGQIVFHSLGDTGNTKGPHDMELVADKMVSDYNDTDPRGVPSFLYHLGDVVYSFGESQYYYDQFYDPFRNYPAPIFAVPGNHDGMVAPITSAETLAATAGSNYGLWHQR
jgi:Calcineurin-like phosphoesterase